MYGSSGWQAAGSTVNGTSKRYLYNITGTPTTLTGASGTGYAEAASQVLAYDAGFVDVFHNGVKMVLGTDVTATSGSSLVFASALANGDVVDIVAYGTFELASFSADNITSGSLNIARLADGSITNAKLDNSSITINGSAVSLGGSVTVGTSWESKSADFTAVVQKAYFIDTSSNAVTATLPGSASIGDEIRFLDVSATFDTNNLTVGRNSHKIQGDASDLTVATERAGFALVYYNATQGWLIKDK